jgi:23S rRNA pseudouridine955/2504/2580 synthase
MREIVFPAKEAPKRVGNFLKKEFPIGYVRRLFRKHGVRINGRRANEADVVRAGDRIQLYIPFEATGNAAARKPGNSSIETLFEDDALVVVNKPAGVAVHEGKTVSKRASILGMLEARFRATEIKPRLVHRLDKDTSGLLIIAKNQQTADELERLFESGAVDKEYLALVIGRLPADAGKIDFPLSGRQGHLVHSLTRFQVVRRFSETTLARVQIDTGRLHQIRLHFAGLGYPIVMDDQHGDFGFNKRFRKQYGLKRQFLHAETLRIKYGGKQREWRAPPADDLQQLLSRLENLQLSLS